MPGENEQAKVSPTQNAMLTFDEPTHTYRVDGRVVPSVTQVLQPLTKLWTNGADLERARQEGRATHRMVELEAKGELDREALPEWLHPIYAEWLKFVITTGFEMCATEQPLYHQTYDYAGTPDLTGTLTKVKGAPFAVIDIKRTLGAKTNGLQTAAYGALIQQQVPHSTKIRRFGLCLKPLRFVEYDDPSDWGVFLAALTMHKWRDNKEKQGKRGTAVEARDWYANWNPAPPKQPMMMGPDGRRSIFDDVDE